MRRYIIVTDYYATNTDCSSIQEVFETILNLSNSLITCRVAVYRVGNHTGPFIEMITDTVPKRFVSIDIDHRILFEEELYDL
jgi:hypothetical protein